MERYIIAPGNAPKIAEWLRTRGGIATWKSVDLSDPGFSMTTPVNNADGTPAVKPHWKLESTPSRIITDPAEVLVSKDVEVKRFHVAIRPGSQGFSFKVTDGSSRRIRAAVEKAGEGAYYEFDYSTQEAVILKPESQVPLTEFLVGGSSVSNAVA